MKKRSKNGDDSDEDEEIKAKPIIAKKWYIIESDSKNKQIWNMFTNVFYMIAFFNYPLVIAFKFDTLEDQMFFEVLLDVLMVFDIMPEFITIRYINGKKLITTQQIAFAYMKSTFIFDTLACVPSLVTGERHARYFYFKVFRYL